MPFGIAIYRNHVISRTDEIDPETGKNLYRIAGLKEPAEPPFLFSQKQCFAYIRQVEPFKRSMRIDPYGYRYGKSGRGFAKANLYHSKEEAIVEDKEEGFFAVCND